MRFHRKAHESFGGARSAIDQVRTTGSDVIGHIPELAGNVRRNTRQVARRLPRTLGHFHSSAGTTVTSLQKMPDSELGLLAAASIGLGAGLGVAGAPRLAALAGFACATILGFAMVSRPGHNAPHPARA